MKPALLALATASIAASGCATDPRTIEQDVTYITEWVGDEPVVGRTPLSLVLGSDGRAFGNAGCNHWFGTYSIDGERIAFSDMAATRKACAEPIMRQEEAYLNGLRQTQRWDISHIDQLRLWPAEGAPIRLWPEQQ